jgi:hypothetical protein
VSRGALDATLPPGCPHPKCAQKFPSLDVVIGPPLRRRDAVVRTDRGQFISLSSNASSGVPARYRVGEGARYQLGQSVPAIRELDPGI